MALEYDPDKVESICNRTSKGKDNQIKKKKHQKISLVDLSSVQTQVHLLFIIWLRRSNQVEMTGLCKTDVYCRTCPANTAPQVPFIFEDFCSTWNEPHFHLIKYDVFRPVFHDRFRHSEFHIKQNKTKKQKRESSLDVVKS